MTKFWKSKLIFIVCLSVSLFLVFSMPALAQVTVSSPQILDATDFTTPGAWQGNGFGECFYLLPGPVVPGDEEPVGPDFFSDSPEQYTSNTCFGAGDPTIDVLFPGNTDWRIYRGDPDEAAFAFTAAPTPADDIQEKAKQNPGCLAGGVLNGPRGTTWDDGDLFTGVGIEPPMASELKVNYDGPLTLAYYFVNGEAPVLAGTKFEECRTQDFILSVFPSVGVPVTRTGTVGEFSMGKYVVFELDGLEGETLLRFETTPSAQDLCTPVLGTKCTPGNFPNCDYAPAENDVLSGVFLSGCEPPPDCSIGDFVFEDANRDGCQDPDERPIEGVEVTLFTYEDCDENPTGTQVTTTNDEGFYEFTGLDCGKEYRVQFGDAGDIYDYTEFESCLDEPGNPDTNDPANDSDCNGDDNGFSGCVTFPDPVNNPNDPTIDCGYVCEGKIGDRVWLDDNEDGCQDNPMDEPGIPMVAVTLSEDCEDRENPVTLLTDENGDYEFTGLCPGEYFVEFGNDLDNTRPGDCRDTPSGPNDPTKDSNCGDPELQCVELTKDNPEDPTIDCGKIPPPCEVEVTKEAEPDIIVCDSGTDGVDTGTNGTDDPCIVKCEDTGTDGDSGTDGDKTDECIAETVTYTITVTNPGGTTVSNIMVDDEVLGFMAGPFTLGPGESKKFTLDGVCIKEDTKNTVVVTVDGELCDEAMAEVMTDFECIDTGTDGGTDGH